MTIPSFPQELTDAILDNCEGDPASLMACSLVCSTWVSRCRSHLFKICHLPLHSFCDLLRSPGCTLPSHVRSLFSLQHDVNARYDCIIHCSDSLGRL
ncbi:hypothetical protein K438DRAFT_1796635 [Mycena galopus ATCC 62051]|nr:hypothetical protein K438DRAFT_1796635 [Mycena galopus ATCC 62051]